MTVTVMETTCYKLDYKIMHYRDYWKYCNYNFRQDILSTLVMENIIWRNGLQKFIDICIKTLDKSAPRKKKYSRGNNMTFINKSLSGAHMKRTRLRKCCLKKCSEQNRLSYVKQGNYCFSLFKKKQKRLSCKLECKRYCRQ